MPEKNISELLNIVRAGAGITLRAEEVTVDDVLPLARAAASSKVPLRLIGALRWRTHDLVRLAQASEGTLVVE